MERFDKISDQQLKHLLEKVEAEMKQREAVGKATKEVKKILTKYRICISDLKIDRKTNISANMSGRPKRAKIKPKPVAPKYQSIDKKSKWTGRGQPPKWVKEVCERDNIDLAEFKASGKYEFKND